MFPHLILETVHHQQKRHQAARCRGLHAVQLRIIYEHVGSKPLNEAVMPFPHAHIQIRIVSVPNLVSSINHLSAIITMTGTLVITVNLPSPIAVAH